MPLSRTKKREIILEIGILILVIAFSTTLFNFHSRSIPQVEINSFQIKYTSEAEGTKSAIFLADSGDVTVDNFRSEDGEVAPPSRVAKEDLMRLAALIEQEGFFSLEENYPRSRDSGTKHEHLLENLTISLNGKTHTTVVWDAWNNANPDVDRFYRVFAEFLAVTRGFNSQKLLHYRFDT